ncbi:MAG: UvrD-helicase domain-containing protein, partial [Thermomicrobiales bacterium]
MSSSGDIELSEEQRAVVEHPLDGGNLLVLAAPGSGKTRVIVERIRWLIEQNGVPPESILAMTFTRRAAGEMIDRARLPGLWAGTIHSVAVDIIFDNLREAGFREPPRIYDENRKQESILRAMVRLQCPLPSEERDRNSLLSDLNDWISLCKRTGARQPPPPELLDLATCTAIYDGYAAVLNEAEA